MGAFSRPWSKPFDGMAHRLDERRDQDYVDMDGPGHITFGAGRSGAFQFGMVQGSRTAGLPSRRATASSSLGTASTRHRAHGRGYARIAAGELQGHLYFHLGDDSAFAPCANQRRHASAQPQDERIPVLRIRRYRPPLRRQMAQLRSVTAEAAPPAINHYEWGGLKADPADWVRRYFDAFVYTANWCSCRLSLRLPLGTFRKAELKPFSAGGALTIEANCEHWIIDWSLDESEDYDRFGMEDGSGWMGRLAPLRDELLRGDLRPLYLGWLASAGEFDDDTLEPEPPTGLSDPTPAQQALIEFIEIDPDLLALPAGSPRAISDDSAQVAAIDTWLAGWSREEMAGVLKLIALGQGREAERHIRTAMRPG